MESNTIPISLISSSESTGCLVMVSGRHLLLRWMEGEEKFSVYEEPNGIILSVALHPNRSEVAIANNEQKQVIILQTRDNESHLAKVASVPTPKRTCALSYVGDDVLIADRAGSVYLWCKADQKEVSGKESLKTLLGHCSLLTDMKYTGRYLVTADKAGRIRLSDFPSAYNIIWFWMFHSAFISRLLSISETMVLSGGGDNRLALWSTSSERELAVYSFPNAVDSTQTESVQEEHREDKAEGDPLASTSPPLPLSVLNKDDEHAFVLVAMDNQLHLFSIYMKENSRIELLQSLPLESSVVCASSLQQADGSTIVFVSCASKPLLQTFKLEQSTLAPSEYSGMSSISSLLPLTGTNKERDQVSEEIGWNVAATRHIVSSAPVEKRKRQKTKR